MEKRYYTGIGSRSTPQDVLDTMEHIAAKLKLDGYILRSGRADGADAAFEFAAGSHAELYIPWPGFAKERELNGCPQVIVPSGKLFLQAKEVAASYHPNWQGLSHGGQLLHTRNVFQVWGSDLQTPSEFLICYAEPYRKSVKGGTATAYNIAVAAGIPTFNLFFPNEYDALCDHLKIEMAVA